MAVPEFARNALSEFKRLEAEFSSRDMTMNTVKLVREGHMRQLFPSELDLNLDFAGVPIANFIDIFAQDIAEGIAPLPSLACVSGKMESQADKDRAEKKNKIGDNYWISSRLEAQMLQGAGWYVSYGFLPFFVEPHIDKQCPFVHVEDPTGAYYRKNRFGEVTLYLKRWWKTVDELCALYPEWEHLISRDSKGSERPSGSKLQLVRWVDKTKVQLFVPECDGLILGGYSHKLSRVPAYIAERPSIGEKPRGQFDDVVYVEVARAIMTSLTLEAAQIAVQAPISVPRDMDEFPIGPHAVYQSDHPEQIRKVSLELPTNIFAENQALAEESKMGSRYPDARLGQSNASVVTGKGVEALLGTYDSQIKAGQTVMKEALQQITAICFEMDEVWWPKLSKTISGTLAGKSYEMSYTPERDVAGRWNCTVTYGFAMGMKPQQSVITMLQLEGAGLISHGTTQMNMPFDIDPEQEAKDIDIESMREALKQGVFALVQTTGQMAAQGQDPTLLIKIGADMIHSRQNGKTLEDSFSDALAAYQKAQEEARESAMQEAQEQQQGQEGMPGDDMGGMGGGMPGQDPNGPIEPGQPAAGGRPTIQHLISGFRGAGNSPVNQSTIERKISTGQQ